MTPNKNIRGLFYPGFKLSNYNLMGQDLVAMEIMTRQGRECVRKFYCDNTEFLVDHPEALLKCLTFASEKGDKLDG